MRVLHVIPSMDPIFGGTVEALLQLVRASESTAQQHEILTLDDPTQLKSFGHGVTLHAVGPTARFYGYTAQLDRWLQQHLADYDCAVIHGCWQYHGLATFRACREQGIPYFQYTHGMLDPWFKHHYPLKHLKKWLYWPWAEYRILKHAARVIFTCEEEKRLAAQSFWLYQVNPAVIPLGIKEPTYDLEACKALCFESFPQLRGKRLLTFMSRIHEKKGVDLLLKAVMKLQEHKADANNTWTLVIAGPSNDESYLNSLKSMAAQLPPGGPIESVIWTGMVRDQIKWGLLTASEAFILPSHQENFGMVVAESLHCGTPVLISDKVNIWKEVERAGAGIVKSDDLEGTAALLRHWIAQSPDQRDAMRIAARHCFHESFEIERNAARFFALLEEVCQNPEETTHETHPTRSV